MAGLWTRQPGTGLYTAYTVAKVMAGIPVLMAYYAPSFFRPHPRWSSRQSFSAWLVRTWFEYAAAVEFKVPFSLEPGQEKERFINIEPYQLPGEPAAESSPSIYRGILVSDPAIKPVTIGAACHPNPLTAPYEHQAGSRVYLHFHGGAYVLFGVSDRELGFGATLLLNPSPAGSAVLFPQFRQASYPDGRFPAALQDAVTAYAYLLFTLRVPAKDIVLSGDSAGGNLALALLRYIIKESAGELPEPGGLLLWSPWVDMTLTPEAMAKRPKERVDILPPSLFRWAYRVFAPQEDLRADPYLSPIKEPLATTVPIWVTWGDQELFEEDILAYVEKQKAASGKAGGRLGVYEIPLAPHGMFLGGQGMGFEEVTRKAGDDAIRFLDAAEN